MPKPDSMEADVGSQYGLAIHVRAEDFSRRMDNLGRQEQWLRFTKGWMVKLFNLHVTGKLQPTTGICQVTSEHCHMQACVGSRCGSCDLLGPST